MYTEEVKGLAIFTGFMTFGAFILGGVMERRLKKVDRVVKQAEDDAKYVN
jgi:hypothetical protein